MRTRAFAAAAILRFKVGAAVLALAWPAAGTEKGASPACSIDTREKRTVTRVLDGETFIVDGGGEVRLAGTLAPKAFDTAGGATSWPLAEQAREALQALIAERSVTLAFSGARSDRHGRLIAHVFTANLAGADEAWVQGAMLQRGLARAYALVGNAPCVAAMIALESVARDASIGLWAEPVYAIRAADDVNNLLRLAGTFQVVEGRVSAVSDTRGTTYVNFGEDWRQDFTLVVRQPMRRALATADVPLERVAGTLVRVRGWIERRGGPMIELSHAGLMEMLPEAAQAARAAKTPRRRSRRAAGP